MKSLKEYEADLVELEATIAKLKKEFCVGDVIEWRGITGVVDKIGDDEILMILNNGTSIEVSRDSVARANHRDANIFSICLKQNNLMIDSDGKVVRWMPKIGEEYWKVTCTGCDSLIKDIRLERGLRHSSLDSLYTNCYPTKAMALASV